MAEQRPDLPSDPLADVPVLTGLDRRSVLRRIGGAGLIGAVAVAGARPGIVAADESDSGQSAETAESDAGEAPVAPEELVVPPAARADLAESDPTIGGRVRRLIDDDRSIWLDTGEGWVSLGGYVFDVRAFGAVGDGEIDDWSAFQAAVEAMASPLLEESTTPYGRTLLVPPGRYRLAQSLLLNRSVRIVGAGAGRYGDAILAPDAGIAGVVIEAADPVTGGSDGRSGEGAVLERIRVESATRTGNATTESGDTMEGKAGAPGVWMRSRAALKQCAITGFDGEGIRIEAVASGDGATTSPAVNGWAVEDCRVVGCGGDGLFVSGASAGLCALLDTSGNGGWGIRDESAFGNTYLACRADGNDQGAFRTAGGGNRSHVIGCASEPGQPPSSFAQGTIVVGGRHGATYLGGNAWTANGSRMLLLAQLPGTSEGGSETAPTLEVRGSSGQRQPHLLVTADDRSRQASVEADGRLFVGPSAPGANVGGSAEAAAVRVQISGGPDGTAGIRWVVLDGQTDFAGWVAQARAFREAAGPDAPNAQAGFAGGRLTFQTPAADGTELDTLTLRGGRVGVGTTGPAAALDVTSTVSGMLPPRMTTEQRDAIASPPEGSLIYNRSTKRLDLFDGDAWQEVELAVTGG